jgi:hypothetical protein
MEDMTLELEFFGEIKTTAAFKALVGALTKLDDYEDDANSARQALVDANLEGKGFKIEEYSYNYRSDALEEIIKVAKAHKIDLVATITEGGQYDPGTIRFVRNGHASFELPVMNYEPALTSEVIEKLKKRGITTIDQLDEFLGYFKVNDLPKFTVADEVISEIFLPKRRA